MSARLSARSASSISCPCATVVVSRESIINCHWAIESQQRARKLTTAPACAHRAGRPLARQLRAGRRRPPRQHTDRPLFTLTDAPEQIDDRSTSFLHLVHLLAYSICTSHPTTARRGAARVVGRPSGRPANSLPLLSRVGRVVRPSVRHIKRRSGSTK